jgi:hypothetical protein
MSFKTILNTIFDVLFSSMGQVHGWVDHFVSKKGNFLQWVYSQFLFFIKYVKKI